MTTQAITADNPLPGFYWMRRVKGGPRIPVAIWWKDGVLVCAVGQEKTPTDPRSIWTWCADNKVASADAKHAFDKGWWPDEPAPIPLGHNNPDVDPYDALLTEVEAKQKQAEDWIKARPTIMLQEHADWATNAQRGLLAINKRADAMFTSEKAPHLAAGRAVDVRYKFRDAIAEVAERLRKIYERFSVEEEARQKAKAAEQLKAEQARVAAERKRLEEERLAKLRDDPVAALTEAPPELPLIPVAAEPVKVNTGGGIGVRSGLKDVWVGTVTDYREAALYFADHPKLRETIDKLVAHQVKDMKAATVIPGVTVTKERRAT